MNRTDAATCSRCGESLDGFRLSEPCRPTSKCKACGVLYERSTAQGVCRPCAKANNRKKGRKQ